MSKNFNVYSPLNFKPRHRKINYSPSIVVPDVNLSLPQILNRYAGGTFPGKTPEYTDETLMDLKQGIDARKLSLFELHQMREQNAKQILKLRTEIQNAETEKRKKEAEAAQAAMREQMKKEIENELKNPTKH